MKKIVLFAIVALCLLSCDCPSQKTAPGAGVPSGQHKTHELLNAVLWMQHSAEYYGLCVQSYQTATMMLDKALEDKTWTAALEQVGDVSALKPAVILDADETVIDNSPYEVELIKKNTNHSQELWQAWCKKEKATAIPGAVEFCNYAKKKGATVFYVTNRRDEVKEATRSNLKALGFPLEESIETVITRSSVGDKGPRRKKIAENHRIVLLIGDNNADFASGFNKKSTEERRAFAEKHRSYWGTKWIVIPNPSYGDWEGALIDEKWNLPKEKLLEIKYSKLRD